MWAVLFDGLKLQRKIRGHMSIVGARTASYFLFFIGLGFMNGVIGPTLPFLSRKLGASIEALSFIFVARPAGALVASYFAGRLYDKVAGHVLLRVAAVLGIVSMIAIAFSASYPVVIVMFSLLGVAEGIGHVGGNTLLIWNHGNRTGFRINFLHSCHGLGTFIIPLMLGIVIANKLPVQAAYVFAGVFLAPFLVLFALLDSPKNSVPARTADSGRHPGRENANASVTLALMLFIFLEVGAEVSFGSWLSLYVTSLQLSSESGAAYLTSAFWGAFVLGRIAVIPLLRRYGHNKAVSIAQLCAMIVTLVFPLLHMAPFRLWTMVILLAVSLSILLPATFGIAEKYMSMQGKVIGRFMVAAGLGGMVLPWCVGQTFSTWGPKALPMISFANLLVALLVFCLLVRHLRGVETLDKQLSLAAAPLP